MGSQITIVQIGDVHYDDLLKVVSSADSKDPSAPAALSEAHKLPRAPQLATSIARTLSQAPAVLIAVCGDLTSKGDRSTFLEALAFLAGVVDFDRRSNLGGGSVHLVPGNHDVAWRGDMPFVDLSTDRFDVLAGPVMASGLGAPLTESIRESRVLSVDQPSALLEVISLNSCRAAGSPRHFPAIADALIEAIVSAATAEGIDLASVLDALPADAKIPYELLDVPFVDPTDLMRATDHMRQLSSGLSVVLAHHGFLPQGQPRIGPYTEMVNGGAVRESLLRVHMPVLYLHGHIHKDTTEVIRGGPMMVDGGPVVVVSAPPLEDGYNEIVVEFDPSGVPMGLLIRRHRVNSSTGAIEQENYVERIPLVRKRMIDSDLKPIIAFLNEKGMCRGSNLLTLVGGSLSEQKLISLVEHAVWQGLIQVTPESVSRPFAEREFIFQ